MAIVDIARGQQVSIPAIQLTSGEMFRGRIKVSDGETLVVEVDEKLKGEVPAQVDEFCVLTWIGDGIQRSCPLLVRSRAARQLIGQVVIQERREAPRVRVELQLMFWAVEPERVKQVADEVLARINTLEEPGTETLQFLRGGEDPVTELRAEVLVLREMIGELMLKIDDLTAIVNGHKPLLLGRMFYPLAIQNCSSGGVGLLVREPQSEGQYLRLRMTMRTAPQTVIDCMGVVVRCAPVYSTEMGMDDPRFDLGIRFTHIHEADRERLIRYLFKVQRRQLRDLKSAREALAGRA